MSDEKRTPDPRKGFPLVKRAEWRSAGSGTRLSPRGRQPPRSVPPLERLLEADRSRVASKRHNVGAGSAGSTILAGAAFGYKLLWVNALAMGLGIVVFAAIGRQTLLTHARPYDVFRKRLHPALAAFLGLAVFHLLYRLAVPPVFARHGGLKGYPLRRRSLRPPPSDRAPPPRCLYGCLLELRAGEAGGLCGVSSESSNTCSCSWSALSSWSSSKRGLTSRPCWADCSVFTFPGQGKGSLLSWASSAPPSAST